MKMADAVMMSLYNQQTKQFEQLQAFQKG